MEPAQNTMQEMMKEMFKHSVDAKDKIINKAIRNKLGKEDITAEDLEQIEMIKQGSREWLMHEGKIFGYLQTTIDAMPPYKFTETISFNVCKNEQLDQMVADQKYQELQARMAEESRQAKLWSAAIQACNESGIYRFGNLAVDRLRQLGFRLEMEGSKQW